MFAIRPEQLKTFEEAALEGFFARLAAYLRQHYPQQCERLGEIGLRNWMERARTKALAYGAVGERAMAQMTELTFGMGFAFDDDPQHEWAGRLLREATPDADRTIAYVYATAARNGLASGHLASSSPVKADARSSTPQSV